jgi:hypothetical protein
MEMATVEELCVQDPFGGSGVFLPLEATAEEILAELERRLPSSAGIAWPGKGAWVDTAASGMTRDAALEAWEGRCDQSA